MAGVHFLPQVIEKDQRQDEFTKTIWDYLDKAVSDDRITLGQKALREQAATLDQIEATYGVDKEVVVAVWGMESSFGEKRGDLYFTKDMLLAVGDRYEGEIAAAKAADAKYR
jgi:membrane-bound lytic murein transglycosylase B